MRSAYCPNLSRFESYEEARAGFRFIAPDGFNIAKAICESHPDPAIRPAIIEARSSAGNVYTFGALDYLSDKLARVLSGCGVSEGDGVAVMIDQSAALVIAHLATWKTGAVVAPLATASEAQHVARLINQGSPEPAFKAAIIQDTTDPNVIDFIRGQFASTFIVSDDAHAFIPPVGARNFWKEIYAASSDFEQAAPSSEAPAFLFSEPRRAVHRHASLIEHLPAFEMLGDLAPGEGTDDNLIFAAPNDWASVEVLSGWIYPALLYGHTILACSHASVCDALADSPNRYSIRNVLLSGREIESFIQAREAREFFAGRLRAAVYDGLISESARDRLRGFPGVEVISAFGTAETGIITSDCPRWFAPRRGSAGRAVIGRAVEVLDDSGNVMAPNRSGRIATRMDSQTLSTSDAWTDTGATGFRDEEGFLWLSKEEESMTRD